MTDDEPDNEIERVDRLAHSDEDDLAAAIREAIGADPDEPIGVVTPQFERRDGVDIDWYPTTKMDIYGLTSASEQTLKDLGLRKWADNDNLWLLPHEWFQHIPEGTLLETINGQIIEFDPATESGDKRFGVLAYGIRREGDDDETEAADA